MKGENLSKQELEKPGLSALATTAFSLFSKMG